MAMNGVEQLIANLRAAKERNVQAALRAIDDAGDQILGESKELCPVSATNPTIQGVNGPIKNPIYIGTSGSLLESGKTEPAVFDGRQIFKFVTYTHEAAAAVHEVPTAAHGEALQRKHPQAHIPNLQGRWKFLAIPILLRREWTLQLVARYMQEANGG